MTLVLSFILLQSYVIRDKMALTKSLSFSLSAFVREPPAWLTTSSMSLARVVGSGEVLVCGRLAIGLLDLRNILVFFEVGYVFYRNFG